MVLDFSDAFWQVPLHADEQRYFCAQMNLDGVKQFLVYLRRAQGSRGAPTSWARLAALVMRLTQSTFQEAIALLCYVDDPLCIISGSPVQRKMIAASIISLWSALGLTLQLRKGQFGRQVTWIGGGSL